MFCDSTLVDIWRAGHLMWDVDGDLQSASSMRAPRSMPATDEDASSRPASMSEVTQPSGALSARGYEVGP